VKRDVSDTLSAWFSRPTRLPLVIRGARQVGKSYLVRQLARRQKVALVELNFEQSPDLAQLFASNDAKAICHNLEVLRGQRIAAGNTLLFLDEIQAAPQVFAALRWFAEQAPDLHVVAAGSLLDFTLAAPTFSMPVGRIATLYVEPMSFADFLRALGEESLRNYLKEFSWPTVMPLPIHLRLMHLFRHYLVVGGMPAAVKLYAQSRSLLEVSEIHHNLLTTYRDDFARYANRGHHSRLLKVFQAIPRQLGQKFVFKHVDRDERSEPLKKALSLLLQARVAHAVHHCNATGVPLGATTDERTYKILFLDTGLAMAALGLSVFDLPEAADITTVCEGALAEQAAGQALRLLPPTFTDPQLYYWCRQKKGAAAEVDYLLQHGSQIVPVEVKAGKTGTLKSLHQLMLERSLPRAIRLNGDRPSQVEVDVLTSQQGRVRYQLVSLPLYMAAEIPRILRLS
jgi:predicted AAA+ superfamily ATPase